MANTEEVIKIICRVTGLTWIEVQKKISKKREELGFFINDLAAAIIVARDLGVSLEFANSISNVSSPIPKSDDILELIIKAKKSMQKEKITEAINILNHAHEIGVRGSAVENLVDIHNLLTLLHYQKNDAVSFLKSLNFANTLATKVDYKRGLNENEAIKKLTKIEELNTSLPFPVSSQFEKMKAKMTIIGPTENQVKKAIFDILPELKLIFKQTGIPLIEIQREIDCDFAIVAKIIKQMIAKSEIMGFLNHRQTVGDLSDDILYLESEPSFRHFISKDDGKDVCSICRRKIDDTVRVSCPNCKNVFHEAHFAEVVKVTGKCPICKKKIKEVNNYITWDVKGPSSKSK